MPRQLSSRQISGKGLRLTLRHAPCAHICRYFLITETRKGTALPFPASRLPLIEVFSSEPLSLLASRHYSKRSPDREDSA